MPIRITIDGGPTENGHRNRGIGSVTRELLEALTPEMSAGLEIGYLRRRAMPGLQMTWYPRSWPAEWAGADPRVPWRVANYWQPIDAALSLPRDANAARTDIFLATDPQAVPLSRRFVTVALLYDVVPLLFPEWYLTRRFAGIPTALYHARLRRMRRADWWIAASEATKQDAVRVAGFDPARISVVPYGVNHRLFRPVEQSSTDRPYFLFVGASDPRKNLATLLEAHREMDVDLVVVGQPPREGGSPRVRWLGHVATDELPGLYAGALAFVFPTLYEGFGLPVLEAMACGTPVITSPVSSIPEVAGDAALYCDPRDPRALRDVMARVAGDSALRAELGERGRQRAEKFTWTRMATETLEVLRVVAQRSRATRDASARR